MCPCSGALTRTTSAVTPTPLTHTFPLALSSTSLGMCYTSFATAIARTNPIYSFNEPDHSAQANLSPAAAAAAWKQYIQPFAGKVKLVSPAVTNGAAPMGLTWLDNFMSACSGCTIDAVAIHIYDSATNVDYFKNYITGGTHSRFRLVMMTRGS